mmetsp:Transcript_53991/g.96695  ORF Transcript_53991/g.96695 Transcript_53991/m.96695 type:complete len:153 (-) Transcript_53991:341-799(-)
MSCSVVKIRQEIDIDASIEDVWAVVSDLANWGSWSKWTWFEDVESKSGTTATLVVSFDGDEKLKRYAGTEIVAVDGEQFFLNWCGTVPCGLFHGNHWIQLIKVTESKTLVQHYEDFSGILPALGIGMPYKKVKRNYGLINKALKAKVEAKAM